jgi:hypothetical protein
MTIVVAVLSVVVVLLAVLVAGLLRSHGEILRRLHELGAGVDGEIVLDEPAVVRPRSVRPHDTPTGALGAAHDLSGAGLRDDAVHVPVVGVEHRTLLVFLSSGCLTCRGFWEALDDTVALDAVDDDVRIIVVTKDAAEESVSALQSLAPRDVPVVMSSNAWQEYEVPGSPYFVLVDGTTERVLGEGTGLTWDQVLNLMKQSIADSRSRGDERESRIDRELLAHGITPGDESLYRTAAQISGDA